MTITIFRHYTRRISIVAKYLFLILAIIFVDYTENSKCVYCINFHDVDVDLIANIYVNGIWMKIFWAHFDKANEK